MAERSQIEGENQADRSPSWAIQGDGSGRKCLPGLPNMTTAHHRQPPKPGVERTKIEGRWWLEWSRKSREGVSKPCRLGFQKCPKVSVRSPKNDYR